MYRDLVAIFEGLFGSFAQYIVPNYPRILILAAVIPSLIVLKRLERQGVDSQIFFKALLWGTAGAIVGARLGWLAFNWGQVGELGHIWQLGGLSSLGGLTGGALSVLLYLERKKQDFLFFADAMAPGVALGLGISRFACLTAGCCFGKATDAEWGITFPASSPAWRYHYQARLITEDALRSLPVTPLQLIESGLWFGLAALLLFIPADKARSGILVGVFLVNFGWIRFFTHYLRPWYPEGVWITGPQYACAALFALGCLLIIPKSRSLISRVRDIIAA